MWTKRTMDVQQTPSGLISNRPTDRQADRQTSTQQREQTNAKQSELICAQVTDRCLADREPWKDGATYGWLTGS